ncbi:MAG TPA: DNA topoisomerase IB [Micromonosporaceae bacterium]
MRLRRSRTGRPGYTRVRRGRGFSYRDQTGAPLTDEAELTRIASLVIPPAWKDVWICPDPRGHIQAMGTDAAGRRQYLYHSEWRRQRDEAKFDHVLEVAPHLPELRRTVEDDLAGRGLNRRRVLATVTRLIDLGLFRVGSEQYASGDDPSYGVATLLREHVEFQRGRVVFRYRAKGGIDQVRVVDDPAAAAVLRSLRRRDGDRLFVYRAGQQWREVRSDDVNEYLREASGVEMTAKDFRTWHATVLAAVLLAEAGPRGSDRARRKVVTEVMRGVAEQLGNTPAVAKSSYVDPRVVELYEQGVTVPLPGGVGDEDLQPKLEDAVLQMLRAVA